MVKAGDVAKRDVAKRELLGVLMFLLEVKGRLPRPGSGLSLPFGQF